jgi:hypothetical protein
MEFGPIQLVVIGFENVDQFRGEIVRELDAVRSRGVIRLIDALFVLKSEDGEVIAVQESDVPSAEVAEIGLAIRALLGMDGGAVTRTDTTDELIAKGIGLTPDDIGRAVDALEPGTAALYLLIEHTWATGLKHAVRNTGGVPLMQGFLTPEAVMLVGAELEAIMEAEATIELAEAVKGAAILDALITIEVADAAAEAAVEEAVATVAVADAVRAQAAAEAVRALIVAELIEAAAAEEAAEVLVAAGLIEAAALEAATEAAAAAQAEITALSAASDGHEPLPAA